MNIKLYTEIVKCFLFEIITLRNQMCLSNIRNDLDKLF